MSFELNKVIVHALAVHDVKSNLYTVSLIEDGGPIVTAGTLDEATKEFEKALDLSSAIDNLLFFRRTKLGYKNTEKYNPFEYKNQGEVEYHEIHI